ncbi:MAG: hypothetical protein V3U87_11385 [Methylococcaceae bacterium]
MPYNEERFIFGNENGEIDPLLQECYINRAPKNISIIVGRWGTGKTAYLLADNNHLTKTLREVDEKICRDWYLSESSLNTDQLIDAFYALDERKYDRYLKELWKAEIVRRTALVLSYLHHTYDETVSPSWEYIKDFSSVPDANKTVWKQIPVFMRMFKNIDDGQVAAAHDAKASLDSLVSDRLFDHVNNCLVEIQNNKNYPIIAIEPIETPLSAIEKEGSIAQKVVSALVNTFQNDFQLSEKQHIKVKISIPWHRFSSLTLNLPQKIRQYKHTMTWDESKLREFISRRITWEFNRVKRQHSVKAGTDAWATLFSPTVHNAYCQPRVNEDSFKYILRHTHYRPREVQRIARYAVSVCADRIGKSEDYVLRGVGGVRVDGAHIRDAVSRYCREATEDLIEEGRRRFPNLQDIVDNIKGLGVPFSEDDLEQRLIPGIGLSEALETLWESGILGAEIACKKNYEIEPFKHLLPDENYCYHRNADNKELHRWYFFEYNWEGDLTEILNRYGKNDKLMISLIVHSRTFENLGVHVKRSWPYGL